MKYTKIFIYAALLSNSMIVMGMERKEISTELTPVEEQCFSWFNATAKNIPAVLPTLSPEDQQVWNQGVKYTEDPQAVIRSRHNYVQAFIAEIQKTDLKLEFDEKTIQSAVLKSVIAMHTKTIKITDELSARMFVYSQLPPDEQATWRKDNYLQSPENTSTVVQRWSALVADLCAKHRFIEDTDEARAKKSQELYDEKMATFKKTYAPDLCTIL